MKPKPVPAEALQELHRRRLSLPPHSPESRQAVQQVAELYGVSEASIYRALRHHGKPRATGRKDRGVPRIMPQREMETYCELIAAIKIRTCNRKKRCLPTTGAIQLLEDFGALYPLCWPDTPNSAMTSSAQ